jgi:hypothetical protein
VSFPAAISSAQAMTCSTSRRPPPLPAIDHAWHGGEAISPSTWEHGLVDLFAKLIERDDYGGDRLRRRTLRAPQPPTGDDGRRQQQYDSEGDDGVGHATDSSSSSSSSEIGPGIGSMKK